MQIRDLLFQMLERFTSHLLQKDGIKLGQQQSHLSDDSFDSLPVVHPPFLPKLSSSEEESTYTLVLDLDETLIHYFEMGSEGGHFLIRPGVDKFLDEMS